ncbi:hypothetical protein CO173_03345 [Candidatus Uhrbacteria bacterium CG_4_9_14_3_um_filter_41_35]|uniref:Uncharacterized protein n=1 Tax=Candidatus Uhrbacteria bacterium CG_4_9_14_3_um_filter_41_35 TaxID=1975034 RepID=A0A2M7XEC1_9BACT|nr:MAG: hypothetical protein CO173_03345 [Candidatus Uhrbacteria bacterium CG_4_9_14_3_um_filter_41_35]
MRGPPSVRRGRQRRPHRGAPVALLAGRGQAERRGRGSRRGRGGLSSPYDRGSRRGQGGRGRNRQAASAQACACCRAGCGRTGPHHPRNASQQRCACVREGPGTCPGASRSKCPVRSRCSLDERAARARQHLRSRACSASGGARRAPQDPGGVKLRLYHPRTKFGAGVVFY